MIRVATDPELLGPARVGTRANLDALAYHSPDDDGWERDGEPILQPLDALLRMSGRALGSARLVAHEFVRTAGPVYRQGLSYSPGRRGFFVRGATR